MEKFMPRDIPRITGVQDMLKKSFVRFPDNFAYIQKDGNRIFQPITFTKFKNDIYDFGTGLFAGLNLKNKKVAIIGENSYSWMVAYMSVLWGQGTIIPMDNAYTEREIENVLIAASKRDATDPFSTNENAKIDAIIFPRSKEEMINRIIIKNNWDMHRISFEPTENLSFASLIDNGRKLIQEGNTRYIDTAIDAKKLATIVFTSGTSADSKAVKLSNANLASNINHITNNMGLTPEDINLNGLPFHHIYGVMMQFTALNSGATTAITNALSMSRDIPKIQPTMLNFVPKHLEFYKRRIIELLKKTNRWELIERLINDPNLSDAEKAVKQEICNEIIETFFGGKLSLILCAAAPLKLETAQFFKSLGINIIEGYGQTESGAIISISDRRFNIPGYTGFPFEGWGPEKISILNPDSEGWGEICAISEGTMMGYYNNPELTAEVIVKHDDGNLWLHSKDCGRILTLDTPYGQMKQLEPKERMDDVIKTDGGKMIFPSQIEELLNDNEIISDSLVIMKDGLLTAIVNINEGIIGPLGISDSEVEALLNSAIQLTNNVLPSYKWIRQVTITKTPFLKTTTSKLRRNDTKKALELAKVL